MTKLPMDPRFFEPGLPPGFDIGKAVVLDKWQGGIDAGSAWYFWPPTRQFIHSTISIAGSKTRVVPFGEVPPEIKEKAGYVSEAKLDWYGATVGHTRAPEGSKYLGIVDGTRYWWHPQWGYMSLAPMRVTREVPPLRPRITRISRDKVPSFLLQDLLPSSGQPVSAFPWETILLLALAYLALRRRA